MNTVKSKLLLTPPSSFSSLSQNTTSATKWGPEIWQAKKSSSSPTHSVTLESPTSLGELSVSSSTTGVIFDLSADVAKQEHLLRDAMARKQKKEAAIRKVHPTSPKNIDGSRRRVVVTTSTGTSTEPTTRRAGTTARNNITPSAQATTPTTNSLQL